MKKTQQPINTYKTEITWIIAIGVTIIIAMSIGIWLFGWSWTGLLQYKAITTTSSTGTTTQIHPGKTLWDCLSLLIIPAVLLLGGYLLNRSQHEREQKFAKEQRKQNRELAKEERQTDRQIATDREEERALQSYFEAITELLLKEDLRESEKDSEVRSLARARTLTIFSSLDKESKRKKSILQFLLEANLITPNNVIINLSGADLSAANLSGIPLGGADLSRADLSRADLSRAYLIRAYLFGADLFEAKLSGADLERTDLSAADLSAADLSGADLNRANLSAANLRDANLRDANLKDANLRDANLSAADLSGADLIGVTYNSATKWPPNFYPPAAGAIKQ